ncbi:HNH endonuclease signature motif containing protein [Mycolicibacterium hodleri]|uniref:HNH endonuclease n=1 Tax=Mycolicibacterium hodleri TaxID=49897 RepID=A0A502E9P7_9MYCO|nr:HNH endonuclease signature motif containing protein [Mycolicibacterium hodleri]TPG33632.1 HNH endonuclease [Mycolicibacterium hodleri]
MFDELVAQTAGVRGAGAVAAWSRVESAACARRLAAMATMLDTAYAADGSASRDQWCLDNWDAVSAHIAAAGRLTSGVASNLLLVAVALRERFPKVQALFADGLITYALVRAIVARGANVTDPDALHALDTALAEALVGWEPMSVAKTEQHIDAIVAQVDPLALRRTQTRARDRSLNVHVEDGSGLAAVFGSLFTPDAIAFDTRLNALADTVCPADPRTKDQRRADAVGALAHGADRLACLCGSEDCDAAQNPPSTGVIIHLIAHHDTTTGTGGHGVPDLPGPDAPADPDAPDGSDGSDAPADPPVPDAADTPAADPAAEECARLDGVAPPMFTRPLGELTLTEALTPERGALSSIRPAAMMGGRFLPGPLLRRAALGATINAIIHPGHAPREPRYTASKTLADFVRCRDQTCRFPGCHEPATNCDLDHPIPWPYGPTSASNLKMLCRKHHLLKTFWGGPTGWRDRQHQDGTIDWIAPDGQTYHTTPGSRLLFPELCAPTAPVTTTGPVPPAHTSGLRMPRRKATRAEDRARRIHDERELNRNEAEPEPDPPF